MKKVSEGRWIPGRRRIIKMIWKRKEGYRKEDGVEQTGIALGLKGLWGAGG